MTDKPDIRGDHAITATDLQVLVEESTYAGVTSFLRRPYRKDLSEADVAVVGVPFDTATTNRPGTRFGPRGIRAASSRTSSSSRARARHSAASSYAT